MSETVTRNVQIKMEVKKAGDPSATFKELEKSAKAAGKSVKDIQSVAQTTTDKLKKMWSDTRDQIKGSEVQVNRLARSIKELGLTTGQVTQMAKQMGQEWKLTAQQIDQALAKAGQGPMGGPGPGFWTKHRSGGGIGQQLAAAGMFTSTVNTVANAGNDVANIVRSRRGNEAMPAAPEGPFTQAVGTLADAGRSIWETFSPSGRRNALLREQARQDAENRDFRARSLAFRESRRGEDLGIQSPFLDAQRAARLGIGGVRDEAAGLRGLGATRDLIRGARTQQGIGLVNVGAGMAPSLFKRPGELEGLRGTREQVGDIARGQAGAEAAAAQQVVSARQAAVRLAQEEAQIRSQAAGTFADRAEKERQLLQIGEQRKAAEQGIIAAIQNQNSTRIQGMQQWKQFAAEQEKSFRSIAVAERERLQSAKEGFGLLDPMMKREGVNIAKRLAGGQELTREQLAFAQGQPIFGEKLREYGAQRAGPEFAEIVRLLGADRKAQEAEKAAKFFADIKVKMENAIDVQVKMDEQAVAQQLTDKVLPVFFKAMADLKQAMETKLQQAFIQRQGAPPP